ncbi:MAG: FtsQ-type POTRA domain-containing protein [Bacillota bacterium]|nr:FtsQ-type POTRA domain-containing protein [Bacillota bacterium]
MKDARYQEEDRQDSTYRSKRFAVANTRWIMIVVFFVVCVFAGYFFSLSGFFAITDIEVYGNDSVDEQRILELSGVTEGMNIFAVNDAAVAAWLSIEPRIAEAKVSRRLPSTLTITVVEREARAMLSVGAAFIEIDERGYILDRYTALSQQSVPLLSGVSDISEALIPGCVVEGEGMAEALEIIAALPEHAEDIGEINVADPQFIKLYTVTGVEIRLGDSSDFAEKYLLYSSILADIQQSGRQDLQYIDVSIIAKPVIY